MQLKKRHYKTQSRMKSRILRGLLFQRTTQNVQQKTLRIWRYHDA